MYSIVLGIISPYLAGSLFESTGKIRMTTKGLTTSFVAHIIYGTALGLEMLVFT